MQNENLTKTEIDILIYKGTERPFSGELLDNKATGIYCCKNCGSELFRSEDKFDSKCGWPSFDDEIPGKVKRQSDADGRRTEILCTACGGHLGHVFSGEGFTEKNTRHCVNSLSMTFQPESAIAHAIFACGCFWGVEYQFKKLDGVLRTTVGYIGGDKAQPSYEEVCSGATGHAEAIEIQYDPKVVSYEALAKFFFEIHDPCQLNRQGPDIGEQYRSEVFHLDETQKATVLKLIAILQKQGVDVVTGLSPAGIFFPAESYHQNYYTKKQGRPYCHIHKSRNWGE